MRRRWIQFLAVGAACAALGVGCGGDDEAEPAGSGAAPEQAEAVTLKVGVIPIADVAPLYLGIKKGFFEEENLTIEPQLAEGGAAIIPSVMSGDYQIGFSNAVSLLIAASKNLPVQIISQGVLGGTSQDDAWDAVVRAEGLGRQDGQGPRGQDDRGQHAQQHRPGHDQQLRWRRPAPTTRRSSTSRCRSRRWARRSRPSASTRRSRSSRRTPARSAAGGTPIFSSYVETAPNLTVATYFASKQYIAENGDVVRALQARDREVARLRGAERRPRSARWSASTRRSRPR